MLNSTCPECGQPKNPNAKRCWECGKEARRWALQGKPHSDERRAANREGQLRREDTSTRFDVSALSKGKPAYNRKPIGSTRVSNGHTQIKCEDGKWRYRGRVVWAEANGPIPRGRLIHHINEDPHDDCLENLQMVTVAEHMRIHMKTNGKAKRLGAKGLASRYGS